jgi:hypothetical protein
VSLIRTNNRRAISAVLTTIIILVASIVLGTAVVVYSTSLFQTGGQQQSITVQGVKGWVNSTAQIVNGNPTYAAWGAAAVRNSGDKILSIDNIQMRGTSIPYTNWFAETNQTRVNSGSNFQSQFNLTRTDQNGYLVSNAPTASAWGGVPPSLTGGVPLNGGYLVPSDWSHCDVFGRSQLPGFNTGGVANPGAISILIDEDGLGPSSPLCLTQQSGPISLNPGDAAIIYWRVPPGVLKPLDSGAIVTVSIFAGKVGAPQTIRISNP